MKTLSLKYSANKKIINYFLLFAIMFMIFQLSVSCSNPVANNIYEIDQSDCTACGKCYDVCPSNAIDYSGEKPMIIQSKCTSCGNCANVCPEDAIH